MMLGIDWASFVPAAALVSLVPGANQLLSLRNALRQGFVDATVALAGRFSAFAILVVLVATGLGAIVTNSPIALEVIRWCGVAYLAYLGLVTLWRARRIHDASDAEAGDTESTPRERRSLVRQEFVVAIFNPKALLLFAAFLPQFVTRDVAPPALQLLILGVSYIAIEAVTALGYTVAGGRIGSFDLSPRARHSLDQITAGSFLALAAYLGFSG